MPRGRKKTNEKKFSPRPFKSLRNLSRLFVFLGRAVFHLSYFIVDTALIIPHITGRFFGTARKPLFSTFFRRIALIKSQVRRVFLRYEKKWSKPLHNFVKHIFHKRKKKTKSVKDGTVIHVWHLKKPSLSRLFIILFIVLCISVFSGGMIAGGAFYYFILNDLPDPTDLTKRTVNASTKIYDRNGVLLYTIYKDENRTPVPLSAIPPQMKLATLAIEDAQFYDHPGFSIRGILRSVKKNIESGQLTGGSTITQQLVKNTLLTPEKTLVRKLKEVTLAVMVEQTYSKDQILEMYLNEAPFGGTAYGVQEAAKTFFGKDIGDVSLAEAALLAGLPRSPTQYSPYGSNGDKAIDRQKLVLALMEQNQFITHEQKLEAEATQLTFAEHKVDIKAPHFVAYVRNLLEEKYGKELVEHGGLSVTTSLDYEIQQLAEKVVADEVEKLGKLNVGNGAALVTNPQTGEILAMVGSRDYFDMRHDGNVNVTIRPRQPGSSIKVVNYAYALSHGMTPATILEDSPITYLTDGQPPYTPKNYEGSFRGNITLRSALSESRNIPAVKVLYTNGINNMINLASEMGITTWTDPNNYGLSLTLGGGEVRLLDLTRVYATIANYGTRPPIAPILKVTNYKGAILDNQVCDEPMVRGQIAGATEVDQLTPTVAPFQSSLFGNQVLAATESAQARAVDSLPPTPCSSINVLDPRVAFQLTDILKDNNARIPSFGPNSLLVIPKHPEVAVKTGTSNDLRDNLAIGYTKDYVVAVWVGNNDNSPMGRIASGVTGATPIWHNILAPLVADKESYEWEVPGNMQKMSICGRKEEWFLMENMPSKLCFEEWIKKIEEQKPPVSVTPTPRKPDVIDLRKTRKLDKRVKPRIEQ